MAKLINFAKRAIRGYFELSAQNYAMRCTGNVWINPDGMAAKA